MSDRTGYTIFCDEVRDERSGKQIFIGVYNGAMVVPSFPTVLKSLSFVTVLRTPKSNPLKSVAYKVFYDSKVILEFNPKIEDIPFLDFLDAEIGADDLPPGEEDPRPWQNLRLQLDAQNVQLEKPGAIRVRIFADNDRIKAGALRILDRETYETRKKSIHGAPQNPGTWPPSS